jgi:D-alanyl-D-alanine carboxypeptidase (penicillin-binding protein 5/6)
MTASLFRRLLLPAALLLVPLRPAPAQGAEEAYIMDATSGHVLDAENATRKVQVGSLTKIATAMVVMDWMEVSKQDLNSLATVPNSAAALHGSNDAGLQPGDRVTIRDLLYAAMLQSDNIAAQTLADFVGQHIASGNPSAQTAADPVTLFVAQMNALARKLGMERTLFLNPHGLDSIERKLPYSTAADMSRLTRYAMSKPAFRFFVSQKERRIVIAHETGNPTDYLLRNTNELLGINAIDGVKTGQTRLAGGCVIISSARQPEARKEGETFIVTPRRLIVVVLGSNDRFGEAGQLLNRGWELYDQWAAAGRPLSKNESL